ncbi:methionyl-tRNA formyltransferase [Marinilabiliaceae bacterium ANBcel2]|nr:methionyl-tRNA formyltransferase [Marinilabiliaceae bacterium ANBcel2]
MKNLRIVFMGTPQFASYILNKMCDSGANVVAVVTAPDKPAGRGRKVKSSDVKLIAESFNIPVLQPDNLKDPQFISQLKKYKADLQVVVAFRMLPEVVWSMPSKGTFNLHASLLPQYRGAAPINHALINGEKQTGVTTFFIDHKIDTGNIIKQETVAIEDDDNAGTLHNKLMEKGAFLVVETVKDIAADKVETLSQKSIEVKELKFAPKIFRDDCKIEWDSNVETVQNKIRGLSPYPGAWTLMYVPDEENSINFKIFSSSIVKRDDLAAGELSISQDGNLIVGCANGALKIIELQPAGKKRMLTNDFLKGYRVKSGTFFK